MASTTTDRLSGLTTSVAVKAPCKSVTTVAITQSGEQTIGSVALVDGDRYLYALSPANVLNGIWVVRAGVHERAKDFNGTRDVVTGTVILVKPGGGQAQWWEVTTAGSIVPGTTAIAIVQHTPEELSLRGDLANIVDAARGVGLSGIDLSLSYAAGTSGWAERIAHSSDYNALRHVAVSQWAAIFDGTSTDDHTTAFLAAVAASKAANQPLLLVGKKWNIVGQSTPIEHFCIKGNGRDKTSLYVDASGMTIGTVALRNTGGTWSGLTIREKTLDKTRAIMLQLSDATALNAVGGSLSFTAFTDLRDVWVFGGLRALDVCNVYAVNLYGCRFEFAEYNFTCRPANDAGDNGYANTIAMYGCIVADGAQSFDVIPVGGQIGSFTMYGGSVERHTTTSALSNITVLSFYDTYLEQAAAVSPITITSSAVFARFRTSGSNCDLTLGTNSEIHLDGWKSGVNHLLGGDGTQRVLLTNCQFPTSGNSAVTSFSQFVAHNSDYQNVTYDSRTGNMVVGKALTLTRQVATYSASMTLDLNAGNSATITATNGTAFTINAPSNSADGKRLKVTIRNAAGGALGVATWDAVFKMVAWTQPANGFSRSIEFEYDGTNWVEIGRTAADVAN